MGFLKSSSFDLPADLKDPFASRHVKSVWFVIDNDMFDGRVCYRAAVEFKNGDTEGKQRLEAGSFDALVRKVQTFIKGLD